MKGKPAPLGPNQPPQLFGGIVTYDISPRDGDANRVDAAFNVVGVRFDDGTTPFSAPVPIATGTLCGVAEWVQGPTGEQEQFCAIQDVNGHPIASDIPSGNLSVDNTLDVIATGKLLITPKVSFT